MKMVSLTTFQILFYFQVIILQIKQHNYRGGQDRRKFLDKKFQRYWQFRSTENVQKLRYALALTMKSYIEFIKFHKEFYSRFEFI
jgi:hypothetical protein